MTSQQQDLAIYDDGTLVDKGLFQKFSHSVHIVSHVEGTKPSWLVNSMMETLLAGTANLVNRDLPQSPAWASVTYISFLTNRDSLVKSCRRQGLDLDSVPQFKFIDCFTNLFEKISNPNDPAQVKGFLESISKQVRAAENSVVFLDGPEFLLAATCLDANTLLSHILKLSLHCNLLVAVVNADTAILDLGASAPSDPVFKITDFFVKLHHKSSLNINIRPLATGKAKDITGCLSVSRGALSSDHKVSIIEKEYVFQVSKEAGVKLYYR